jgi:hypothetical protein
MLGPEGSLADRLSGSPDSILDKSARGTACSSMGRNISKSIIPEPFEIVAFGGKILQALIDIKEPSLTGHRPTLKSAKPIESRRDIFAKGFWRSPTVRCLIHGFGEKRPRQHPREDKQG